MEYSPSSSTASTVAPRLRSTSTTVARPFRAAIWSGLAQDVKVRKNHSGRDAAQHALDVFVSAYICSALFVALMREGSSISARISSAHIS